MTTAPTAPATATLTPGQREAANEFVRTVLGRLRTDGGVHAETAVAAAAGMAGTYLLRSFRLPLDDLEAGAAIFSDRADAEGPALLSTLHETLGELGITVNAAAIPPRTPAEHLPQLTLLQIQLMFGVPWRNTIRRLALSHREAAFAGAVAAARIVKDCSPVLTPPLAVCIAVTSLVEATKTVPIKVPGDDDDEPAAGKRPWYRFW